MALKLSTSLRNCMLGSQALSDALALGFIKIYAGTEPADANAAVPGGATLLCTISLNSTATGLSFDAPSNGTIPKAAAEVWSGVVSNAGALNAAWYRHVGAADTGVALTDPAGVSQPRLQGSVGVSGADLNLSSVALTNGATQTLDYYSVTLPTL